jgi:hypothetical protein
MFLILLGCSQDDELGRRRNHHETIFWGAFRDLIFHGRNVLSPDMHDILRTYPKFVNEPVGDIDKNRIFAPLTVAIMYGQEQEAIMLIRYGANLDIPHPIGVPILPLHAALQFDKHGLVTKYLLVYGAPGADISIEKIDNVSGRSLLAQWRMDKAAICDEVKRDLDDRVGWYLREYEKAERGRGMVIREFPDKCGCIK